MLFVVRGLQELGRGRDFPWYMCFIDQQEEYNSVDGELPWEVLARLDVPAKGLAGIRQFHERMLACVRTDDDERSEWFDVTRGGTSAGLRAIAADVWHVLHCIMRCGRSL